MDSEKDLQGMIQVYTGDGKGKTTAALGLALRAVGHGLRVHVIQFMKNPEMMGTTYGEISASKSLVPGLVIHSFGLPRFVTKSEVTKEDKEEAEKAMRMAFDMMRDKHVSVLILDEVFLAVHFGLVGLDELLKLLDEKPPDKEIVLTGRKAPDEVIERADLVTEMREIKHYFSKGVSARQGIEY